MKRVYLGLTFTMALTFPGSLGANDPTGIQRPASSDPCSGIDDPEQARRCMDEAAGGAAGRLPAAECGRLCPLPCTFQFNAPLFKGHCLASIERCNGRIGFAICQCNGNGVYFHGRGTKHLMYQR